MFHSAIWKWTQLISRSQVSRHLFNAAPKH